LRKIKNKNKNKKNKNSKMIMMMNDYDDVLADDYDDGSN
jgi:hypothetical protein